MSDHADSYWAELLKELRQAIGINQLSDEEAAREYAEAEPLPLNELEVFNLVENAVRLFDQIASERNPSIDSGDWVERDLSVVDESVMQLNRNAKKKNSNVTARLNHHRDTALGRDGNEPRK